MRPAARDTYLWDDAVKGFGLKCTRFRNAGSGGGKKVYLVQYRLGGRCGTTKRVTLGPHGALTPDQARKRAKQVLGDVAAGLDPAALKRQQREEERAALSLANAAERFLAMHAAKLKPSTASEYARCIRRDLLPPLGHIKVHKLTRAHVAGWHHDMRDRPYHANRCLAVLGKLMSWCIDQGLRPDEKNPARRVEKYAEIPRERFLTEVEFSRLGNVLREAETSGLPWEIDETQPGAKHIPKSANRFTVLSPYVTAAIRLLSFTGCRLGEILALTWDCVDLERSVLEIRDHKTSRRTRRAKLVPLSTPARAVLANLPRILGFPHVICGATAGVQRSDLKHPWSSIRRCAHLEGMRIHDLRHSFASIGAGSGLSLPIIGSLLGHTQMQTTQRYAHLAADPRQQAAEMIARRAAEAMGELLPEQREAEVVPFARKP